MIKIGIVGGTGYTAGELIRLLVHHPKVDIKTIISKSSYGKLVHLIHKDLLGDINNIKFSKNLDEIIDVMFICSAHGQSKKELIHVPEYVKVIDLSQDFRIFNKFQKRNFVYGLPELKKELIKKSSNIANPGCFATSILLSILPLAIKNLIKKSIHISAITGSTGSGKKLSDTNHFSWRNNNISTYKIFKHQHLKEIIKNISEIQKDFNSEIYFIPYRGNFSRGIITTMYTNNNLSLDKNIKIYKEYYSDHPFVYVSDDVIDIKQVINTNKCFLFIKKEKNQLIIVSVLDNLLKGASGQAVQNMNLMFNLNEDCGLKLKSINF
ncbi:N-acetyl-gamma-glutamyl-phosphate reductase [Blattabacterium cuenoti]|uniref:N-acetyl-gamma-glutamyl-phosphate reductase n=1 Tax=Blattabacterium cuenoti TaxID=1653831 RepID=UPI00163B7D79|nr:N-acetyl-gamma-glutamyl-phosphate reductase [Blattabacterium cuenoti]